MLGVNPALAHYSGPFGWERGCPPPSLCSALALQPWPEAKWECPRLPALSHDSGQTLWSGVQKRFGVCFSSKMPPCHPSARGCQHLTVIKTHSPCGRRGAAPQAGAPSPATGSVPSAHVLLFSAALPKTESSSDVFYSPTECEEKWQDFPINMTLITQMCKPLRRDPGEFHTLW